RLRTPSHCGSRAETNGAPMERAEVTEPGDLQACGLAVRHRVGVPMDDLPFAVLATKDRCHPQLVGLGRGAGDRYRRVLDPGDVAEAPLAPAAMTSYEYSPLENRDASDSNTPRISAHPVPISASSSVRVVIPFESALGRCPRSSVDRAAVSETACGGSIPPGGTNVRSRD